MSLFQQASNLNNRAITALIEGNDKVAIQAMTQSIKILKQELAKEPADESDSSTSSMTMQVSSAHEWKTVKIPDFTSGDDHHNLFDHVIQVPCCQQGGDGGDSCSEVRISAAAVIFNLALAHHRHGMQGNGAFRQKAAKLYTMVLRILDDSLIEFGPVVMIKLASLNNLVNIQLADGDEDAADEGLRRLAGIVRQSSIEVLTEPTLECLLFSLLSVRSPNVAAAA